MKIKPNYVVPAVASAVALACGSVSAATLAIPANLRVTNEYITSQAANSSHTITLPKMNFTLESNAYTTSDSKVRLTVSGGTVAVASSLGTVTCNGTNPNGAFTVGITLTYESVASNVITFTVNSNSKAASLINAEPAVCSFDASKISILTNSLSANSAVSVNFEGFYTSGVVFDKLTSALEPTGFGTNKVMNVISQFSAPATSNVRDPITPASTRNGTLTALAKKVLTAANNKFTGTAYSTPTGFDTLVFTTRDEGANGNNGGGTAGYAAGANDYAVDVKKRITTITGDFNFLDDDANGCTSTDLTAGAAKVTDISVYSGVTSALTIDTACSTLTHTVTVTTDTRGSSTASTDIKTTLLFTVNGAASDGSGGVTQASVDARTGLALPIGKAFGASTNFQKSDLTSLGTASFSPGVWASADAAAAAGSANIPYLPYGSGISRIVYLTNNGSATATVSVSSATFDGASTTCSSTNFTPVTVPKGGVGLLTGMIDAGLAACGVTSTAGQKANVNISVSGVADGSFKVTSNYNVNGDRVNIINSTN